LLDQGGALVRANARIGVLDPPTSGIVNIELTAATTAAFVPGLYTDELQITIAGRTSIVRGLSIRRGEKSIHVVSRRRALGAGIVELAD
jgi:hypothetical protein